MKCKSLEVKPGGYEPGTEFCSPADNVIIEIVIEFDNKVIPINVDTKRNAGKLMKLLKEHCTIAGTVRYRGEP